MATNNKEEQKMSMLKKIERELDHNICNLVNELNASTEGSPTMRYINYQKKAFKAYKGVFDKEFKNFNDDFRSTTEIESTHKKLQPTLDSHYISLKNIIFK